MAGSHPEDDQIVVAILHERLVLDRLQRLHITAHLADRSHDLGLSLWHLPHDQVVAAAATGDPPLDAVLRAVYAQFEADYDNMWVPTMGKNRAIARVAHNIGFGGEGLPTPVSAELHVPSRPGPARPAAVVGIADTSLHPHPALAGGYVAASTALLRDVNPSTDFGAGHATFIAGAVLREASQARLEVYGVLDETGQADSWDVAMGLVALGRAGIDVLNMSFGCFTDDNLPPLVLVTAIDRLDAGIVLVAAAGNHAHLPDPDGRRPLWPAALDDVLAVGATDHSGARPPWSQSPHQAPWIDVLAGGVDVLSTYLPGRLAAPDAAIGPFPGAYARWSGTSFAAARVSGAIAARIVPGRFGGRDALAALRAELPRRDGLPWLA